MSYDLSDYVDVKTRIQEFWKLYPTGSIQTEFMGILPGREDMFWCVTRVWRSPEDERPITGMAAELVNGKTSFTRNSELMNLESSSVGRCLGMLNIGIKKSLASRDEVLLSEARNKGASHGQPEPDPWATIDQPPAIKAQSGKLKTEPRFCEHGEMWRHHGENAKGPYVAHNCPEKKCDTQWQR